MSLEKGMRLGPYEVLGQLGRGGMGEVYRARDSRLGRDVAIKVLPAETRANLDALSRFQQEARMVAALNHPNIMALHDIGNTGGVAFAVMELLEGETLRERLEEGGRLLPARALGFAVQIARGLAAAHERGIVHRDLKPENIFVTRDGRVKILDFGLAQGAVPSATGETRPAPVVTGTGMVLGTPGYISPEQMIGELATVRSDLFAFGVVAHEMLTGLHPFLRGSVTETASAILRDDPPRLDRAVPGLPPAAVKILERCVEKQAADRPGSARDLALYLEAILASGEAPVAGGAVPPPMMRRRGGRSLLAASCGMVLVLSAAPAGLVRIMANRAVTSEIDADLARAEQVVRRLQADRLAKSALNARVVASFPELKALFATDQATVRDYLVSYQQRNPGVPLLLALSPDGAVIARTDNLATTGGDAWIAELIERHGEPRVVSIGGRQYHAAAAAAEAGGNLFGYVVAATPVDAEFAGALREATQDEMLLLSDAAVLASTLRSAQSPWRSRGEWRLAGGGPDRTTEVSIGTQRFVTREVALVDQPSMSAVILKSRDEAFDPFRRIQNGLALLALFCVAVAGVAGASVLRRLAAVL